MDKWEIVTDYTYRLKVPGGWLYRYSFTSDAVMIFVADPDDILQLKA